MQGANVTISYLGAGGKLVQQKINSTKEVLGGKPGKGNEVEALNIFKDLADQITKGKWTKLVVFFPFSGRRETFYNK